MLFANRLKEEEEKNAAARFYCRISWKCQKVAYFHAKPFAKRLITFFKSAVHFNHCAFAQSEAVFILFISYSFPYCTLQIVLLNRQCNQLSYFLDFGGYLLQ